MVAPLAAAAKALASKKGRSTAKKIAIFAVLFMFLPWILLIGIFVGGNLDNPEAGSGLDGPAARSDGSIPGQPAGDSPVVVASGALESYIVEAAQANNVPTEILAAIAWGTTNYGRQSPCDNYVRGANTPFGTTRPDPTPRPGATSSSTSTTTTTTDPEATTTTLPDGIEIATIAPETQPAIVCEEGSGVFLIDPEVTGPEFPHQRPAVQAPWLAAHLRELADARASELGREGLDTFDWRDDADIWQYAVASLPVGPNQRDAASIENRINAQGSGCGGRISLIGDSLTVGARDLGGLEDALPGVQITAEVGKSLTWGINQAQSLAANGSLRPILALNLGTNGLGGVVDLAGATSPDGWIVLVIPRTVHGDDSAASWMRRAVSEMGDSNRIVTVDMSAWAEGHDEWIAGDGVHYTSDGYQQYAAELAARLCGAAETIEAAPAGAGGAAAAALDEEALSDENRAQTLASNSNGWAQRVIARALGSNGQVSMAGLLNAGVPMEVAQLIIASSAESCPEYTPAIMAAQLYTESGFRPEAVSDAGAQGIAQFMPGTWPSYGVDENGSGVADPFEPADAIPAMIRFMCDLVEAAKEKAPISADRDAIWWALRGYNCGAGSGFQVEARGCSAGNPYPDKILELARTRFAALTFAATGTYSGEWPPTPLELFNGLDFRSGYGWTSQPYGYPEPGTLQEPGDPMMRIVIAFALQQVGKPYWNQDDTRFGPDRFDCSGLIYTAFSQVGIYTGNYTFPLLQENVRVYDYNDGGAFDVSLLMPGDLIFTDGNGAPDSQAIGAGHVGLFVGFTIDGVPLKLHASSTRGRVRLDPIDPGEVTYVARVIG